MNSKSKQSILIDIYNRLIAEYGPQHWWPGETPFEVIIGAILTQSAAWTNVEKAINNLKAAGALSPVRLRALSQEEIASLIRPSGYYNAKAVKLKAFVVWLGQHYRDNLDLLFTNDVPALRYQLLAVHGIGEETADSIILYAAGKPVFVIDAYTKRIMSRLGILPDERKYDFYQQYFMKYLPLDSEIFNEYHALLVRLAKHTCRKNTLCDECCLNDMCQTHKNQFNRNSRNR